MPARAEEGNPWRKEAQRQPGQPKRGRHERRAGDRRRRPPHPVGLERAAPPERPVAHGEEDPQRAERRQRQAGREGQPREVARPQHGRAEGGI